MRPGETPVPIPNTMVKPRAAENTTLATAWEDRWMPEFGDIAQLGEHLPCKQGVKGSNPFISTDPASFCFLKGSFSKALKKKSGKGRENGTTQGLQRIPLSFDPGAKGFALSAEI